MRQVAALGPEVHRIAVVDDRRVTGAQHARPPDVGCVVARHGQRHVDADETGNLARPGTRGVDDDRRDVRAFVGLHPGDPPASDPDRGDGTSLGQPGATLACGAEEGARGTGRIRVSRLRLVSCHVEVTHAELRRESPHVVRRHQQGRDPDSVLHLDRRGVQGASLAFHLADRGLRPLVLERAALAGGATAGRAPVTPIRPLPACRMRPLHGHATITVGGRGDAQLRKEEALTP